MSIKMTVYDVRTETIVRVLSVGLRVSQLLPLSPPLYEGHEKERLK